MINVTLEEAEQIVKTHAVSTRKDKLTWDGWTLVYRKPNNAGWLKKNGATIGGKWFVEERFPVQPDGTYELPSGLAVWNPDL